MSKHRKLSGKSIKKWYENHPLWVILGIVFFVLSLAIAAGTVFSFTSNYITSQVLWRGVEQSKIDKLAPTQTLAYFNSVLGEPNTKEQRGKISIYVYKARGYWVEAFVDDDGIVQVMDITACGEDGFYPKIKNNPMGSHAITLGKTKMSEAAPEELLSKRHYYHKLATAPSYYYDQYYNNASGNYQTMYTGHNDLCGYLVLPDDILSALTDLDNQTSLTDSQAKRLRDGVTINTFAVTSPTFNTDQNKDFGDYGVADLGSGGIGVSYIDKGVLTPTKEGKQPDRLKIEKTKEFDIIKFDD